MFKLCPASQRKGHSFAKNTSLALHILVLYISDAVEASGTDEKLSIYDRGRTHMHLSMCSSV
jgi:hypothetical protein